MTTAPSAPTLPPYTAIETLENAPLGTIAYSPAHDATIIKMSTSGMPWMRDPWTTSLNAERLTTAYAAMLGFEVGEEHGKPQEKGAVAPTVEHTRDHIKVLRSRGIKQREIAEAIGVRADTLRKFEAGRNSLSEEYRHEILTRDWSHLEPETSSAFGYAYPRKDRLEDLAWLLETGSTPEAAAARCGWPEAKHAARAARAAGLTDLHNQLIDERYNLEAEAA